MLPGNGRRGGKQQQGKQAKQMSHGGPPGTRCDHSIATASCHSEYAIGASVSTPAALPAVTTATEAVATAAKATAAETNANADRDRRPRGLIDFARRRPAHDHDIVIDDT